MKKLLVLSALLGLLALPAFTADVTFGGDLNFGFITDFDDEAETSAATIDMKGSVDDYNSVDIRWAVSGAAIEKAAITTDIGAWLGLPLGVSLQWGYDDPDFAYYGDVTNWETEAFFGLSPAEYWGLDLVVSVSMLEFELAANPADVAAGDLGYLLVGAAVKEPIAGLNVELYYFQNESAADAFDQGQIGFGAGYAGAFGDLDLEVGANFAFDMADTPANEWVATGVSADWGYGIGVTGAFSIAYVEVSLTGTSEDVLDNMTAAVHVGPFADLATLFGALAMDFADSAVETFQGAEFGLEFETGATWWCVGYQINNDAFGGYNGVAAPADGGLFLEWDINY